MIDSTTPLAVAAWASLGWMGVTHLRQIAMVRAWARAEGLPLAPSASRMPGH